jgi:hypothetical protein
MTRIGRINADRKSALIRPIRVIRVLFQSPSPCGRLFHHDPDQILHAVDLPALQHPAAADADGQPLGHGRCAGSVMLVMSHTLTMPIMRRSILLPP